MVRNNEVERAPEPPKITARRRWKVCSGRVSREVLKSVDTRIRSMTLYWRFPRQHRTALIKSPSLRLLEFPPSIPE